MSIKWFSKAGRRNDVVFFLVFMCVTWILFSMGCVENHFIYFPRKYPDGNWDTSGVNSPPEDCYFTTKDGVKLHGWFAAQDGARVTIIWFHGNAGNITGRLDQLLMMRQILGVNVFLFDYRGYGRSEGTPSEKGLYKDAEAAYEYMLSRPEVSADAIYLCGKSLGAAVAAYLAQEGKGAGVILEAAFSSLMDVASELYPWLPARFVTKERYDSLKRMPQIKMPVLIIHGTEDHIMSQEHSEKLYKAALEPKELLIIQGGGHNDLPLMGGKEYWGKLREFIGG